MGRNLGYELVWNLEWNMLQWLNEELRWIRVWYLGWKLIWNWNRNKDEWIQHGIGGNWCINGCNMYWVVFGLTMLPAIRTQITSHVRYNLGWKWGKTGIFQERILVRGFWIYVQNNCCGRIKIYWEVVSK